MLKRYWGDIKQFIKFNLVGVLNTVVDFLIYTLLTEVFGWAYLFAKTVSYSCGVVNSYIWNSRWTFKAEQKRGKREFLLFLLVNLVSLGVSLGIMHACKNWLRIESDFWCNIIATPIALVVNFLGNKLFVFKKAA